MNVGLSHVGGPSDQLLLAIHQSANSKQVGGEGGVVGGGGDGGDGGEGAVKVLGGSK